MNLAFLMLQGCFKSTLYLEMQIQSGVIFKTSSKREKQPYPHQPHNNGLGCCAWWQVEKAGRASLALCRVSSEALREKLESY